ncbi:unnamed protein product, partial [Discosporangium mesarthrocarpum]
MRAGERMIDGRNERRLGNKGSLAASCLCRPHGLEYLNGRPRNEILPKRLQRCTVEAIGVLEKASGRFFVSTKEGGYSPSGLACAKEPLLWQETREGSSACSCDPNGDHGAGARRQCPPLPAPELSGVERERPCSGGGYSRGPDASGGVFFSLHKVIGEGSFGRIHLASLRRDHPTPLPPEPRWAEAGGAVTARCCSRSRWGSRDKGRADGERFPLLQGKGGALRVSVLRWGAGGAGGSG